MRRSNAWIVAVAAAVLLIVGYLILHRTGPTITYGSAWSEFAGWCSGTPNEAADTNLTSATDELIAVVKRHPDQVAPERAGLTYREAALSDTKGRAKDCPRAVARVQAALK